MATRSIDTQKVEALLERARREVDTGHLPACQVALAFEGELVAFETFGDASDDTRFAFFSATKAFVAAVARSAWTQNPCVSAVIPTARA